jgi:hypothetical protein
MSRSIGRNTPHLQHGAPERTKSHYVRMFNLLKERGAVGVTSDELYEAPQLYGRSPRNRIAEMRKRGLNIATLSVSSHSVRYVLISDEVPKISTSSGSEPTMPSRKPGPLLPLFTEADL